MNKAVQVAIVLVLMGGSFYGGVWYGGRAQSTQNNSLFSNGRAGGMMGQFGAAGVRGSRTGGGFVAGDIIAKDTSSITLKLRAGGSLIVFLTGATPVEKFIAGNTGDLAIGSSVAVNGTANPDGSIIAYMVQIRPATTTTPQRQ